MKLPLCPKYIFGARELKSRSGRRPEQPRGEWSECNYHVSREAATSAEATWKIYNTSLGNVASYQVAGGAGPPQPSSLPQ